MIIFCSRKVEKKNKMKLFLCFFFCWLVISYFIWISLSRKPRFNHMQPEQVFFIHEICVYIYKGHCRTHIWMPYPKECSMAIEIRKLLLNFNIMWHLNMYIMELQWNFRMKYVIRNNNAIWHIVYIAIIVRDAERTFFFSLKEKIWNKKGNEMNVFYRIWQHEVCVTRKCRVENLIFFLSLLSMIEIYFWWRTHYDDKNCWWWWERVHFFYDEISFQSKDVIFLVRVRDLEGIFKVENPQIL